MDQLIATTDRLLIRSWCESDRQPLFELNQDPEVMEFLGPPLSRYQSDQLVDRFVSEQEISGYCPWVVELSQSGEFVGFVGLQSVPDYLNFVNGLEVVWRLKSKFWGLGLATEAAHAALRIGFGSLGLAQVVSMTSKLNVRSQRVMQRLGISHNEDDDFKHPAVDVESRLRAHVLYQLSDADWRLDVDRNREWNVEKRTAASKFRQPTGPDSE